MKTILIDNGHGSETLGKQSPDGKLLEYKTNRIISSRIADKLKNMGYNAILLVPEDVDMSLGVRVNRANTRCREYGVSNCVLISVHCNAAGCNGEWQNARGIEAFTTIGDTKADKLAEYFYDEISKVMPNVKLRKDKSDGDSDKEKNFYLLRKTLCPAILTENFFMDNLDDVEMLKDDEILTLIADAHVAAVDRYFSQ